MSDGGGAGELGALVAVGAAVEVVEGAFAPAQQDRDDHEVQVVDQAGPQALLDRGRTTADPDVEAAGGLECSFQRVLDAADDEMERGPHRPSGWTGGGYG